MHFSEIYALLWLIVYTFIQGSSSQTFTSSSRFDGWYNNPAHAHWGSPGQPLTRTASDKYVQLDHTHMDDMPPPNPRIISERLLSGEPAETSSYSLLMLFFGQHIVDDIVDTRRVNCPNSYMNVQMSEDENDILPFYRSKFIKSPGTATPFPTTPINEATSWVDGSAIYGGSVTWADHLREFRGGRLKTEPGTQFPFRNREGLGLINPTIDVSGVHPVKRNPHELLGFGNPRGNENVFLMTIGIVFFRYHNYLAKQFSELHPEWSDEMIYMNSRRKTVAVYQNIAMYEWLPLMIGNSVPQYTGYNNFLEPGILTEFSTAAMRVGHSMVPIGSVLRRGDCSVVSPLPEEFGPDAGEPALRLCNSYWQLQDAILKHGIDDILRGMISQPSEQIDNTVGDHLRNFLYGPVKRTRMDLETLTVQRGRDHGLPMYNSARKFFGLPIVSDFAQFSHALNEEQIAFLRQVYYNDTDHIELYVGGMLESKNGQLGELFSEIIKAQFLRLRDSDRFWFENTENRLFNSTEIYEIKNTTFYDIIIATTNITENEIQKNVFNASESSCRPVVINELTFTRNCTGKQNVQLFHGFWGKYATLVVVLILFPLLSYALMLKIAASNRSKQSTAIGKTSRKESVHCSIQDNKFKAIEIEGKDNLQKVDVELHQNCILVKSDIGKIKRKICMSKFRQAYIMLSRNRRKNILVVRVPKEYDLVLKINNYQDRDLVHEMFKKFFQRYGIRVTVFEMDETALLLEAITKDERKDLLERFFHRVFHEILGVERCRIEPKRKFGFGKKSGKVVEMEDCELSVDEMADMLGMTSQSLFVQQMFQSADKDNSGYLSMREFTDLIILLMDGSAEQKVKLLFEMYDTNQSGKLDREEGEAMIRSFLEVSSAKMNEENLQKAVSAVFAQSTNDMLTLEDFTRVMLKEHKHAFKKAMLSMPGLNKAHKKSLALAQKGPLISESPTKNNLKKRISAAIPQLSKRQSKINSEATVTIEEKSAWKRMLQITKRWVENHRRHIFCMVIFYTITFALIIERAEHYAWHSEHTGIRRVTEFGIIMSRTTAAAISFHYSFILLTMCRNLITFLRETFLNTFIPFDSAIEFHRHIAYVAMIETVIHVLGHVVNVYHFSVHPLPVLACVFPKVFVDDGSDVPRTFIWWAFQNITGITGILLVFVLAVMYVFAMQFARRYCFRAFWWTHNLFVIMFVLTILHGSVGLIQPPLFHVYLAVPALLYAIDKLIMISRSKAEISVLEVQPLPSNVLNLVFQRPPGFDYKSGQWVRIACPALGNNEYHPFTLTSAPHEEHLSLHIRSVGPWTTNLRHVYETASNGHDPLPKIFLDGPFGEGHQDWYKYDVSVLVGAGIGVTPFASILKDIVNKNKTSRGINDTCQKVYFIWVTRTQRHFEWLTDIIKEVESCDVQNLVDIHIYITQFQNKFDLRTTMLYICERYFQKVANTSLFTGLKARTHFGRPQFAQFLNSVQYTYKKANRIGVFSCGPPGLTKGVEVACRNLNHMDEAQFVHYYENF